MLLVIPLEKSHKYIRRRMVNGRWVYEYPHGTDSSGKRRVGKKLELALKSPVVETIKPLLNPTPESIGREFNRLEELSRRGKLRVRAWGNCPVVINRKSRSHLFSTKGNPRVDTVVAERCLVDGEVKTIEVSLAFDKQRQLFFLSNYEVKKGIVLTTIMENESLGQLDNALSFISILDDFPPVKSYAQLVRQILQ